MRAKHHAAARGAFSSHRALIHRRASSWRVPGSRRKCGARVEALCAEGTPSAASITAPRASTGRQLPSSPASSVLCLCTRPAHESCGRF